MEEPIKQSGKSISDSEKSQEFGKLHKWLSEHKVLKHLAIHLLIAALYGAVYYVQSQDKDKH